MEATQISLTFKFSHVLCLQRSFEGQELCNPEGEFIRICLLCLAFMTSIVIFTQMRNATAMS